jgi:hydrogenase maturation factor
MCRTTVGRVIAVEDGMAVVDLGEMRRTALALMVPDLAPGDLVLVGLGAVLGRVAPDDEAALDAIQRPRALPTQVLPADRPTP